MASINGNKTGLYSVNKYAFHCMFKFLSHGTWRRWQTSGFLQLKEYMFWTMVTEEKKTNAWLNCYRQWQHPFIYTGAPFSRGVFWNDTLPIKSSIPWIAQPNNQSLAMAVVESVWKILSAPIELQFLSLIFWWNYVATVAIILLWPSDAKWRYRSGSTLA